jgi:hypothetical protein
VGLGAVTERFVSHPRTHDFSTVVVAVLLYTGLADYFGLSPLFLRVYLGTSSREGERQLEALEPIVLLTFTAFFTLAGISLRKRIERCKIGNT